MFVRAITVKGKKYYRLVESYRQHGKVKQRYITSIGNQEALEGWGADMITDILEDLEKHRELYGGKKEKRRALADIAEDMVAHALKKVRQSVNVSA
jgi:hypothetical protein